MGNAIGSRQDLMCARLRSPVYWTDILRLHGTAGFLLRDPGELIHTRASLLLDLTNQSSSQALTRD
eukprot:1161882-Pelagomonas_calceolata.AAC.11